MLIEIPDITVVRETVTDGFRGVDDTAAADSEKKINALLSAELDSLADQGKTRIWDNAAEFHIGDSGRVPGLFDPSKKTGADHTAASVVEQDFFTVYIFYKLSDPVFGFFSEYDAGRGIEIKIKHKTPS